MNVSHDLVPVADLIAAAFKDDMDPVGERSVREMRSLGRWAFLFGWLNAIAPPGEGMVPGFVWVEDEHIVGNTSVRLISRYRRGWLIGNVAVAPGWRRRGIARSLMQAAIDMARQNQGDWIVLQVRSDSTPARNLYLSFDFKELGETIQYRRAHFTATQPSELLAEGQLRRGRASDIGKIFALAKRTIPDELRLTEPLRRSSFWMGLDRSLSNWFNGRSEAWWVIDTSSGVLGAAHIEVPRAPNEGRLRIWVAPERQGMYETSLTHAALTSISHTSPVPIMAHVIGQQQATSAALESSGFEEHRRLTHMRLKLK